MKSAYEDRIVHLKEINQLYEETAGNWLLLEILETNENGTPTRMRVAGISREKDTLFDWMMENEEWDWKHRYLLVFADPNKPCTIQ